MLVQVFGEQKRWVNYRIEIVDGRRTKVPYAVTGAKASSTDSTTWSTYAVAARASDKVGIVFTAEKMLLGIDIDHCLKDGALVHEQSEAIASFIREAATYTEVSPSGEGLHAFLIITEPLSLTANRKGSFECYTTGRYFTVTGNSFGEVRPIRTIPVEEAIRLLAIIGYPWNKEAHTEKSRIVTASIAEDAVVLEKMFASKHGQKIRAVYEGNTSEYGGDDSSADMALCSHLAYWTAKDAAQMERIWLASPLGSREKTQKRKDYRDRTISAGISGCLDVYVIGGQQDTDGSKASDANRYTVLLNAVPKDTPKEDLLSVLQPLLEALALGKSAAEAELYIRNKVKEAFGLKERDIDPIVRHFKEFRKPIVAKRDAEKKKAEQTITEPPPTEEERRVAERLLQSPTLLHDILQMVRKLGVVGEERNVLLHYIIFTSRKLQNPLSATVKGDSSSGKSFTLLTTMRLFPKSAYIDLTDATPQSFYYCPEDHFKHKMIVLFEKHGGERADYAIRTLQSEGKLKIQVTVKNPETGAFEAQTIEKEGPTGFVTTTTASMIHAENDTRNISMFPDQSSEQTGRVYAAVDARYTSEPKVGANELQPWHHAQLILEELPVYIPFVRSFRRYFPKHIVRTRRDYGHFLAIVETVAFLHQKQRAVVEVNGVKHIRATLADAYLAKVIVEESLAKSIYELPEKTVEVIRAARALVTDLHDEFFDGKDEATFTITQLAKKLEWDRDTVAKWLKPASKKGYVTIVTDSKGSKGAEYKVEEKELPSDEFLPSVAQLAADNPTESIGCIYDPLSGEKQTVCRISEICTDAPIPIEAG